MIAELFRYWTTLSPERVRKYGYLKRLIALEFRAERCKSAWAPHVARAHAMIIKAADLVPQPRTCVILGSGLLIEVPLQALADRFERSGETVFCYTHHPDLLLQNLAGMTGLRYLHRPANLEDLFLKLTGREMRD